MRKSKHSSNKKCFVSARLAIVDGTHLCLLPPSESESGSGGGGGNNKKRHRTPGKSQPTDNGNGDACISVPALPLSSVWKTCGTEYISCSGLEENDDDRIDETETTEGSVAENNSEPMPTTIDIETIRLRKSDLSNAEYRFISSLSAINGSNSQLPIRVSLCDEMEEGSMFVSDDDQKMVEIFLPSSMSASDPPFEFDEYEEDDFMIYGGECHDILGGDMDLAGTEVIHNQSAFEVHGAGSCLVADFLGIAGHEQALVTPRLDSTLLSDLWDAGAKEEESIQQRKQLLRTILGNSFLTDGSGILCSKQVKEGISKTKTDDTVMFTMSPLDVQSTAGNDDANSSESNDDSSCSEILTQHEASQPSPVQTKKIVTESDANNTKEVPAWLEAIAETVEHRLAKEVAESQQVERSTQVRSELVNQGRKTLHMASRFNCNNPSTGAESASKLGNWRDPEILRLRYGTRPRISVDTCGGISVMLDLEVDVYMPSNLGSEESNNEDASSSSSNALQDFHLSCSLADIHHAKNLKNMRTFSGVVPTLQSGECITILASVLLTDLQMSLLDSSETSSTLDLSIQGLWVDDSSNTQKESSDPTEKKSRHGAILCILRLPTETLFLAPPITSVPHSGRWIQHEIDFTSDKMSEKSDLVSDAIFEYRQHRTLIVDTSGDMNSTLDANMWKQLVSNLNARIGGDTYIDLYCKKDDPRLKLVVFGSNPEERATTVKLVLRSLPESAKLIIEDPDEKRNVKALLMSLKNEADALKRHRSLPSNEIRPEILKEMTILQMHTDGVASTIKRGWT